MNQTNFLKVIIHRGTKQIGGCCTEISTATTRVLIDFGSNLNNTDKSVLTVDGVTNPSHKCDAILISHYHADHMGELIYNSQFVPVYMTTKAIQIQKLYQSHMHGKYMSGIQFDYMKELHPGNPIIIGDLNILPIKSEHSAFEPLMFLIESNGKKILHTGDFRMHGQHWGAVQQQLNQIGHLDLLITEGTCLSRENNSNWTEFDIQNRFQSLLQAHKYCFLLTSSSNISRIETFANSIPRGKYFIMDGFQKDVLKITDCEVFKKALVYGTNLSLKQRGFGMIVRANDSFTEIMKEYLHLFPAETCLIYSMWSGYLEKEGIRKVYEMPFKHKYIVHSSGHVTKEDLNEFMNQLNPDKIIFIHTDGFSSDSFDLKANIMSIQDKEVFYVI